MGNQTFWQYFSDLFYNQYRTRRSNMEISVNMYLLNRTPPEVLVAIFLLTTTYSVSKGVKGIIHLSLLFVPIIFLIIIISCIGSFHEYELENLLPILAEKEIVPILKGSLTSSLPFLGDIPILFYFMSYVQKDLKVLPLTVASILITLTFIFIIISAFALFTVETVQFMTFPFMEIVETIEVPGRFFERLESIVLTIWIMALFTSTAIYQLLTSMMIKDLFLQNRNATWLSATIVFIAFLLAFFPASLPDVENLGGPITFLGIGITCSGIFFGYLTLFIRKRT